MFSYIRNFFSPNEANPPSLEEAYDILHAAEQNDKPKDQSDSEEDEIAQRYKTLNKVGVITSVNNCQFEIDNVYKFTSEKLFAVDMKVSYTVFNDEGQVKVTNVTEFVDEWAHNANPNKGNNTWCIRHINIEVVKRCGRILYGEPGNIQVNLNETISEFVPIVGDFLELEAKCEIDESVINLNGQILEIIKIRPVRTRVIDGAIKKFNEKFYNGVINAIHDVYFNKESLSSGYIPKMGDKVVAEIIECNKENCGWRALKIVLKDNVAKSNTNVVFGNLNRLANYEHTAPGIQVSENVIIAGKKFNDSQNFTITITNEKNEQLLLNNLTIEGQLKQVKLSDPKHINKLIIEANSNLVCSFIATLKSLGKSREIILFHFANVVIGRSIYIELQQSVSTPVSEGEPANRNNDLYLSMRNFSNRSEERQPLRGEPRKMGPRFAMKPLAEWRMPKWIVAAYCSFETMRDHKQLLANELVAQKPSLMNQLSLNNYEDKFHTMVYLEELHNSMSMRKFDKDRVRFITDPTYLILEIDDLAESRPSIIIGDKIIATCLQSGRTYEGFVHKTTGSHVMLKFAAVFKQQYKGEDYRIHVEPSRSTFRKEHEAIQVAKLLLGDVILFPNHVLKKKPQVKFVYEPYADTLGEAAAAASDNVESGNKQTNQTKTPKKTVVNPTRHELIQRIMGSSPSTTSPTQSTLHGKPQANNKNQLELKLEWFNKDLNYYQKEAVRNILVGESRPLPYIIFGPPGTGKTITIIECILQILRMVTHSRILIATPSNSAAILVTRRLVNSGSIKPGDLVRLVSFKSIMDNSIPADIIPYCATASLAREGTAPNENHINDAGLVTDMTMSNIGRHRITIGTCSALGVLLQFRYKKGHFTHIIVDEAGQCTEPEIMIPLSQVDTVEGQIILAGDPMQLGPVVLDTTAKQMGFEETYLDRLICRFPYIRDINGFPNTGGFDPRLVTKLIYNYRSLPELLCIPNKCFYHNELRPTISTEQGPEAEFLKSLSAILPISKSGILPSLIFHGINGTNVKADDCPSWYNPDEAAQIFFYVNELYRVGVKKDQIGIISPYVKQVKYIRQVLQEAEYEVPKVGTIEEFQGLEFNVIILSIVRSQKGMAQRDQKFALGFISNPRRFNVAMTRAKCMTIIIGNPTLVSSDTYWNFVLTHCVQNGTYVGCDINSQ